MTLEQIKGVINTYLASAKQGGNWSATFSTISGLLDKIAKTVVIDSNFVDKLSAFNGEKLEFGRTIEETFENLAPVKAYADLDGGSDADKALKYYKPDYLKPYYSYDLGNRIIPVSIKMNEYEKSVRNADEFASLTNLVLKRMYDSKMLFDFNAKKALLANFVDTAINEMTSASKLASEDNAPLQYHASSKTTAASKALVLGDRYFIGTNMAGATAVAICVKSASSASKTWNERIADGNLVELNLTKTVNLPIDTITSEAFLKAVKADVELAGFAQEGVSLNGNTVAAQDLVLVLKAGVMPTIEVEALAGAFNRGDLAIPAKVIVVDNIPSTDPTVFAVLTDSRSIRLHPTYQAVREQENGANDHKNFFYHIDYTAFYSRNTFLKVYKSA